jgi:hypothetical protein
MLMQRALGGLLVFGLATGLFAAIHLSAIAEEGGLDQFGPVDTVEMVFFPFVPQGEMIDEIGPWYGSITVQNLEDADVRIWVFTDAAFDPEQALGRMCSRQTGRSLYLQLILLWKMKEHPLWLPRYTSRYGR